MLSLPLDRLDRRERLERAGRYLDALKLGRLKAIVFGSVARGDFTAESDTDLLIVSDELPQDRRQRLDVLFRALDVAPEVEPIGWTLDEWQRRRERGDPFVAVVEREGVPLR